LVKAFRVILVGSASVESSAVSIVRKETRTVTLKNTAIAGVDELSVARAGENLIFFTRHADNIISGITWECGHT
jgi:hypothetical protein